MATEVAEVMNTEVFTAAPEGPCEELLFHLLTLGITSAPVVDEEFCPVGVVSIRDLLAGDGAVVADVMTVPADTVLHTLGVEEAAMMLAITGRRHLVVVDDANRVTGFVSAHDMMCALLGQPVRHPDSFPHYDPVTRLKWSDPVPLTPLRARELPSAPGLLQVIRGGLGQPEKKVWIAACRSVKDQAERFLADEDALPPRLHSPRARGELRVRFSLREKPVH